MHNSTGNGFKIVLFDLDGTLINSEQIGFEVADFVMTPYLKRGLTNSERRYMVGKPLMDVLEDWFPGTEQEIYDKIIDRWESVTLNGNSLKLYDGVFKVLSEINGLGMRMGIVSSKQVKYIVEDLKDNDIEPFFETIVGQEDTKRHKPFPDPLLLAAERLNIRPESCIYIGDQPTDVSASRSANMKSAVALWGNGEQDDLFESKPDYIFDDPVDILDILFPK